VAGESSSGSRRRVAKAQETFEIRVGRHDPDRSSPILGGGGAIGSLARPDVFDVDRIWQGRAVGTSADPDMLIIVEGNDLEALRPAEQVPRTDFDGSAWAEPVEVA
jgi:hypothetical protein